MGIYIYLLRNIFVLKIATLVHKAWSYTTVVIQDPLDFKNLSDSTPNHSSTLVHRSYICTGMALKYNTMVQTFTKVVSFVTNFSFIHESHVLHSVRCSFLRGIIFAIIGRIWYSKCAAAWARIPIRVDLYEIESRVF